jgi:IMP dehydrogenase/GMP reductase
MIIDNVKLFALAGTTFVFAKKDGEKVAESYKGEYKNVEGKKILIDYRGNMERLLVELQEDLQSSISYVGGTKTADLINAEIIVIN